MSIFDKPTTEVKQDMADVIALANQLESALDALHDRFRFDAVGNDRDWQRDAVAKVMDKPADQQELGMRYVMLVQASHMKQLQHLASLRDSARALRCSAQDMRQANWDTESDW